MDFPNCKPSSSDACLAFSFGSKGFANGLRGNFRPIFVFSFFFGASCGLGVGSQAGALGLRCLFFVGVVVTHSSEGFSNVLSSSSSSTGSAGVVFIIVFGFGFGTGAPASKSDAGLAGWVPKCVISPA